MGEKNWTGAIQDAIATGNFTKSLKKNGIGSRNWKWKALLNARDVYMRYKQDIDYEILDGIKNYILTDKFEDTKRLFDDILEVAKSQTRIIKKHFAEMEKFEGLHINSNDERKTIAQYNAILDCIIRRHIASLGFSNSVDRQINEQSIGSLTVPPETNTVLNDIRSLLQNGNGHRLEDNTEGKNAE